MLKTNNESLVNKFDEINGVIDRRNGNGGGNGGGGVAFLLNQSPLPVA